MWPHRSADAGQGGWSSVKLGVDRCPWGLAAASTSLCECVGVWYAAASLPTRLPPTPCADASGPLADRRAAARSTGTPMRSDCMTDGFLVPLDLRPAAAAAEACRMVAVTREGDSSRSMARILSRLSIGVTLPASEAAVSAEAEVDPPTCGCWRDCPSGCGRGAVMGRFVNLCVVLSCIERSTSSCSSTSKGSILYLGLAQGCRPTSGVVLTGFSAPELHLVGWQFSCANPARGQSSGVQNASMWSKSGY